MATKKKAPKKESKTLFLVINDNEQVCGIYTKEGEAIDHAQGILHDGDDPYVVEVEVKSVKEVLSKPAVEKRPINETIDWDGLTTY